MTKFVLAALIGIACTAGGAGATDTREMCAVEFSNLPATISALTINSARLVSRTSPDLRLLKPSAEGMFVVRASSTDRTQIVVSYRSSKRSNTVRYPLPAQLFAIDWSTVAETAGDDSTRTVSPGLYRVVVRYEPSEFPETGEQTICLLISPTFELTNEVRLAEASGSGAGP